MMCWQCHRFVSVMVMSPAWKKDLSVSVLQHWWQSPVQCFPMIYCVLLMLLSPILSLHFSTCSFCLAPLFLTALALFWIKYKCLLFIELSHSCCRCWLIWFLTMLLPCVFGCFNGNSIFFLECFLSQFITSHFPTHPSVHACPVSSSFTAS